MALPAIDHATLPVLTGARCTLRPLRVDDVTQRYVDWLNDPAVNRHLESRFATHTLDTTRAFLAAQLTSGTACFFGIWAALDGGGAERHVGNIKLGPIERNHLTSDLGFVIGERDHWGRGLASDAINTVVAFGFGLGLKKVTAGSYEDNPGSAKALLKAGFVSEGLRPDQVISGDRRVGIQLFGRSCS